MSKWDEICTNVGRAASKTLQKTEELAESASMHVKLTSLKAKRDKAYEKLGRLTYKQIKSEESQAEAVAKTVSEIDGLNTDIAKQKQKIEQAKQEKQQQKQAKKAEKQEAEKAEETACVTTVHQVIIESTASEEK